MGAEYVEEYVDEIDNGISFSKVIKVLFGHPKIFIIIACYVLVSCIIGLCVYSNLNQDYECDFSYNVTGITQKGTLEEGEVFTPAYIDGSNFDVRDLITLEKLEKYKASSEALSGLDMNVVSSSDAIKNISMDGNGVVSLVLKSASFSTVEATALAKAVANEPIEITKTLADKMTYDSKLRLFDSATNYEDKVAYLIDQQILLEDNYAALMSVYGDVIIPTGYYGAENNPDYYLDGKKISDIIVSLREYAYTHPLRIMEEELTLFGYIYDPGAEQYSISLKNKKARLERDLAMTQAKLDNIIIQRNDLVDRAQGTMLQTAELAEFNSEIVLLSNQIEDIREEIALNEKRINNLDVASRTDEYNAGVESFNNRLNEGRINLEKLIKIYSAVAKRVIVESASVYFSTGSVIYSTNTLSFGLIVGISAGVAIIIPILVNIVISIVEEVKQKNGKSNCAGKKEEKNND